MGDATDSARSRGNSGRCTCDARNWARGACFASSCSNRSNCAWRAHCAFATVWPKPSELSVSSVRPTRPASCCWTSSSPGPSVLGYAPLYSWHTYIPHPPQTVHRGAQLTRGRIREVEAQTVAAVCTAACHLVPTGTAQALLSCLEADLRCPVRAPSFFFLSSTGSAVVPPPFGGALVGGGLRAVMLTRGRMGGRSDDDAMTIACPSNWSLCTRSRRIWKRCGTKAAPPSPVHGLGVTAPAHLFHRVGFAGWLPDLLAGWLAR